MYLVSGGYYGHTGGYSTLRYTHQPFSETTATIVGIFDWIWLIFYEVGIICVVIACRIKQEHNRDKAEGEKREKVAGGLMRSLTGKGFGSDS